MVEEQQAVNLFSLVWHDTFRPSRSSEVECLSKTRRALLEHLRNPSHPALVCCVPTGCGKTSIVRTMLKENDVSATWVTSDDVHDSITPWVAAAGGRAQGAPRRGGGFAYIMRQASTLVSAPKRGAKPGQTRAIVLDQLETLVSMQDAIAPLWTLTSAWNDCDDKRAAARIIVLCDAPMNFKWRRMFRDRGLCMVEDAAPGAREIQDILSRVWARARIEFAGNLMTMPDTIASKAMSYVAKRSLNPRSAIIDFQVEMTTIRNNGKIRFGGYGSRDEGRRALYDQCDCVFNSTLATPEQRQRSAEALLDACGHDAEMALSLVHNNGMRPLVESGEHGLRMCGILRDVAADVSDASLLVDSFWRDPARANAGACEALTRYTAAMAEATSLKLAVPSKSYIEMARKDYVKRERINRADIDGVRFNLNWGAA